MTVVLQTYVAGKTSPDACEDFLFVDGNFIAVIDGASDKTGTRVAGRAGGWIVGKAVKDCLQDREKIPADIAFEEWVARTTSFIDGRLKDMGWPEGVQRPAASAIVYSRHRGEMWRVGDCHFRIDGVDFLGGKAFDDMVGETRRTVLQKALDDGASINDLRADDIGRAAILDTLRDQYLCANNPGHEMGYPVFNGDPIPTEFLERPHPVSAESLVVMTSDGFDFPHETLEETIERQRISYEKDPLRIGADGGRASTKALAEGAERHDDQCYGSFTTTGSRLTSSLKDRENMPENVKCRPLEK